jgi:hypothetical protein
MSPVQDINKQHYTKILEIMMRMVLPMKRLMYVKKKDYHNGGSHVKGKEH